MPERLEKMLSKSKLRILEAGLQPIHWPAEYGVPGIGNVKPYTNYTPPPLPSYDKERGREAWKALHTMKEPNTEKINQWLSLVPSAGCGCADFAVEFIARNPPPFDDRNAFFEWTWRFHDTVDLKTGDERMTLAQAKEFWAYEKES